MSNTYRIDGAGDAQAFFEANNMAHGVMVDLSGAGGSQNIVTWLPWFLAAVGAAAAAMMLLLPVLETFPALSRPAAMFFAILFGVGLFIFALAVLNRWISQATARAYLSDPMMQNHHVILSEEGMRVVSGKTFTVFHWSDVTRIDATANVILVTAGMAWGYIPVACFAEPEQVKAALADMRAWQKAVQE